MDQRDARVRRLSASSGTNLSCTDTLTQGVTQRHFSTPCGMQKVQRGRKELTEGKKRASHGGSGSCALLCSGWPAFDTSGLTSILHRLKMQHTAHVDTSRVILEIQIDQAGAPRAGVGLQPSAPLAVEDGADGTDAALYRRDRGRMPATLGRGRPGLRPVRSGRGGSVAAIAAGQI